MNTHTTLVAVFSLFLVVGPSSAEECAFLPSAKLDAALPAQAPWSTLVGGAGGRCKFLSRSDQYPSTFSLTQVVQEDEAAAAAYTANLRTAMAKSYQVELVPALGQGGFSYRPLPADATADSSIWWVGFRGGLVVMGSLVMPQTLSEEARRTGEALVVAALGANQRSVASAVECAWLDTTALAGLLGPGQKVQAFGSNSCLATDSSGGKAVIVTIFGAGDGVVADLRDGDCTWKPVPDLGAAAVLGAACTNGVPRAFLQFEARGRTVRYAFTPPKDTPSQADLDHLVEVARRVQAQE